MEIERKFIVEESYLEELKQLAEDSYSISQAYLLVDSSKEIRVRSVKRKGLLKGFITIKIKAYDDNIGGESNIPLSRHEYEYGIPYAHAQSLFLVRTGSVIEKVRYKLLFGNKTWTLDIYEGIYKGLAIAEVELADKEEEIELPEWAGREVTHLPRYFNSFLALNPS